MVVRLRTPRWHAIGGRGVGLLRRRRLAIACALMGSLQFAACCSVRSMHLSPIPRLADSNTSIATVNFTPEDRKDQYYRAMLHAVGLGSQESGTFRVFFNHGRRVSGKDAAAFGVAPWADASTATEWSAWSFDLTILGSHERVADDVTTWSLLLGWKGDLRLGVLPRSCDCFVVLGYDASSPPSSRLFLRGLFEGLELRRVDPRTIALRLHFRISAGDHAFPAGRGNVTALLRE